MTAIQSEIENIFPEMTWDVFTQQDTGHYHTIVSISLASDSTPQEEVDVSVPEGVEVPVVQSYSTPVGYSVLCESQENLVSLLELRFEDAAAFEAALVAKLPEDATLVEYKHDTLELLVTRN